MSEYTSEQIAAKMHASIKYAFENGWEKYWKLNNFGKKQNILIYNGMLSFFERLQEYETCSYIKSGEKFIKALEDEDK